MADDTNSATVNEGMPYRVARTHGCVPYICKGRIAFVSEIKATLFGLWLRALGDNGGKLERIKPSPVGAPSMGLLAHFTQCECSSVIIQYASVIVCASVCMDRCIQ